MIERSGRTVHDAAPGPPRDPAPGSLAELARLFVRLGATSFGGPAAHIAMMEDEVVDRRRWLTREEFLDMVGATNFIPGPNSTELAIHIGLRRAGWKGLLVAGSCFILPAVSLVLLLAWIYVRFGALPATTGILAGVAPVVVVIVGQALWRLGRTAVKSGWVAAIAVLAVIAVALGVHELAVLGAAALIAAAAAAPMAGRSSSHGIALGAPLLATASTKVTEAAGLTTSEAATVLAAATTVGLAPIFLFFLKVGSVLFGSGYVLLAFLRADLVVRWGWLSEAQLLDAIAIGQVTPGPVFTTATFIGYLLAGVPGALLATLGIFLPAFVFVAASGPILPLLRRSRLAGAVLDGVNAASLALMAVVTWHIARSAFTDLFTITLGIVSAMLIIRLRISATWVLLGAAAVGLVFFHFMGPFAASELPRFAFPP